MSKVFKVLLLGVLLSLLVVPAAAQDAPENVIVDATFGDSIANIINPITYSTATDGDVLSLMLPLLFTANPETALYEPGVPGTVAESWEVSEDGGTVTFHLRQDYFWSDGTPVTARDWEIVWDAVQSGQVETRLVFNDPFVDEITAIDDYTLEVTLENPNCESLGSIPQYPFPAHMYTSADGTVDWATVAGANVLTDPAAIPAIGPYQASVLLNDQQIAMVPVAGEGWPAENNYPTNNDGYVFTLVGDQVVLNEQLLAGNIDYQDFIAPADQATMAAAPNLETYQFSPGDRWDYFMVNHANPNNPQPAVDEAGNPVEFDPHPIFADVRVRRALAHAINMDQVVQTALNGAGVAMPTMYPPGTWVYPEDVPMYAFDPALALELLAEAGWVDDDNDPSTPLVATEDAMYAEPGTPFTFSLLTNQGNTRRGAFGQIIQDNLSEIGIQVDFQAIDFNVLVDMANGQTFDTMILGWVNGYPYTADVTQLFGTVSDVINGSNSMSWHNADFDALMEQALTLPGCDPAERAAIYAQAAAIYHEELPYIAQFGTQGMFAWQNTITGVDPFPANMAYNVSEWTHAP